MTWELHPAKSAFPTFAEDWDRLNAQLYNSHPYYDSRFVGPLLDFFATGKEQLCILRTDDIVTGALILQPNGLGRWSSFRPSQAQITPVLLADSRLLNSLFRDLPGFAWTIELLAIDPRYSPDFTDPALSRIAHAQARTIGIHLENSFPDYWAKRPKKLISNIGRYSRRADKESVTLLVSKTENATEMASGVTRYGLLEAAGWKGKAGTAVSNENRQVEFYSEVMRRFALTKQSVIYELHREDQLTSSRLVISNAQMVVFLKTTYDESLAHFAPGRILLLNVIQDQFEAPAGKSIEFYTNATRDQAEWATFGENIQNIQIFRNEPFAVAFSLLKTFRRILRGVGNRTSAAETSQQLDTKVCTSIEAFAEEDYDLQEFAPKDNIETSIEWFDLLQKQVYPNDAGVRFYFVAEGNRPETILPLRLTTKGRVRTIESLGNYYTSLYTPLLTEKSDLFSLREMLAKATRDHGVAHVMRFAPMDPNSPAYEALLKELKAIGWIPFRFFCFGNWYLRVSENWDAYLKKRSANLRSSIKRRTKEFAAAGGILEIVTTPLAIEQAINAFQDVYSASWKIPEPYPNFVPELIHRLSSKGMLRLGIAHLGGKPIAAQLWIVAQDIASIYKLAYNEAYASCSPGTVLTTHLMRHVIEQDHVKEVDFLTGDDKYKRIWMSDRRERWGIVAYNPRTMIGLALFIRELTGRMARSAGNKLNAISLKPKHIAANQINHWKDIWKIFFRFQTPQRDINMIWTTYPISQLANFSQQWDELVRSRPGTPFLETAFLLPSVEFFSTGKERLCLLHSNGQLRAAAIMNQSRMGVWQTFQPSQLPLGAWISDGKIDLLVACNSLFGKLSGLSLSIGLTQIDSRFQTRPTDTPKTRPQDYIRTSWVNIEGGFEDYWEGRGKNLRQNTRKQRNKLEADGVEIKMECIEAPEDVQKAIEDYGLLESKGWKAADGTAILPDNDQGRFYRKMLENYCSRGQGRIYRYSFGDKIVAMDLCIHDREAIVILKTAYDESYKSVSPSTLMRQEEFQHLFEEGKFARIEFYGKVMEWHTRWTTQDRSIYHTTSYRWAWLKQLHARVSKPADQTPSEILS